MHKNKITELRLSIKKEQQPIVHETHRRFLSRGENLRQREPTQISRRGESPPRFSVEESTKEIFRRGNHRFRIAETEREKTRRLCEREMLNE